MPAVRRRFRARSRADAPALDATGVIDLRNLPSGPPVPATTGSTGWLSGGGEIASPAGSWSRVPAASGTATFGLVVRRLERSDKPTGFVSLTFGPGALELRSSGFDWLLFVGRIATVAGWGTVNGTEGYTFKGTAIDGGDAGQSGLRIKIWLSATGKVVYDSEPTARGEAPSKPITSGSVVAFPQ